VTDGYGVVECAIHGRQSAAFVCRHLNLETRVGFVEGYDPNDPDTASNQAWCAECDRLLVEEGEWNDRSESFAQPRLVCRACYNAMKRLNLGG
jgi:hypothetical protein